VLRQLRALVAGQLEGERPNNLFCDTILQIKQTAACLIASFRPQHCTVSYAPQPDGRTGLVICPEAFNRQGLPELTVIAIGSWSSSCIHGPR
jgi:hypothetical protein